MKGKKREWRVLKEKLEFLCNFPIDLSSLRGKEPYLLIDWSFDVSMSILWCIHYRKLSLMYCVIWNDIFNLELCFWTRIRFVLGENCGKLERKHVSSFGDFNLDKLENKFNYFNCYENWIEYCYYRYKKWKDKKWMI